MTLEEFFYVLPEDQIAQIPTNDRSSSRMLVLYRNQEKWEDRSFADLPEFLGEGDCLIVNDSRVFPSRLYGRRPSGARIEVFLTQAIDETQNVWEALVRPGRKVPVGETIIFSPNLTARVLERGEFGRRILEFSAEDFYGELEQIGHVPLPPYIKRPDSEDDRHRYQTVFAKETGSIAAPTAGLHFTPEILDRCRERGVAVAPVTLHVGLGTFAPLRRELVEQNELHYERFSVPDQSFDTLKKAKRRIAVGTTSVRAVESAYALGSRAGKTKLFIYPGYQFQAVDAMLTNFHLPKSSLLMLVSAFAGKDFTLAAYHHAVERKYRFFSYGDCMLIV
jgi:S-adenosylmethionine:tRNA ribosyltransferase-isomerase